MKIRSSSEQRSRELQRRRGVGRVPPVRRAQQADGLLAWVGLAIRLASDRIIRISFQSKFCQNSWNRKKTTKNHFIEVACDRKYKKGPEKRETNCLEAAGQNSVRIKEILLEFIWNSEILLATFCRIFGLRICLKRVTWKWKHGIWK